jgi:segregation and condensation protein B
VSDSQQSPASRERLKAALEALIFVSDEPIPLAEALVALGEPEEAARAALEDLRSDYDSAGRGLRIEEVGGGFRIATRPDVAPYLNRLARLRHRRRLSGAALETLAVVAYRQPITGPEIQEIRGVNPEGALKTLLDRRLLRIAGRKKVVGRPLLYGTTKQFLLHFGLNSLDDLPPVEEFERLLGPRADAAEMDPAQEGAEGLFDGGESGEARVAGVGATEEGLPARFGEEE